MKLFVLQTYDAISLKQIPKKGPEESVMSNYGNNIKILMHKHCVGKCAFHKGMV